MLFLYQKINWLRWLKFGAYMKVKKWISNALIKITNEKTYIYMCVYRYILHKTKDYAGVYNLTLLSRHSKCLYFTTF